LLHLSGRVAAPLPSFLLCQQSFRWRWIFNSLARSALLHGPSSVESRLRRKEGKIARVAPKSLQINQVPHHTSVGCSQMRRRREEWGEYRVCLRAGVRKCVRAAAGLPLIAEHLTDGCIHACMCVHEVCAGV